MSEIPVICIPTGTTSRRTRSWFVNYMFTIILFAISRFGGPNRNLQLKTRWHLPVVIQGTEKTMLPG